MRFSGALTWLALGAAASMVSAQPVPIEGLRWLSIVGIDGSPTGVVTNARRVCAMRHPESPAARSSCEDITRSNAGAFLRDSVPNDKAAMACAVLATSGGATDWSEAWYCLTANRRAKQLAIDPQKLAELPTGEVITASARCLDRPDAASEIVMTLSKGAPVSVVAREGDWLHLTRVTYRDCWAPAAAVRVHSKAQAEEVGSYEEAFYGTKK